MQNNNLTRFHIFIQLGQSGQPQDVDLLMQALLECPDLATSKLVDYALSLIESHAGRQRLRHYLFEGEAVQRNFAALYFKRREEHGLLDEAVARGKIDLHQAYAQ